MFQLLTIKEKVIKVLEISAVGAGLIDKTVLFFGFVWSSLNKKINILPILTFTADIKLFGRTAKCSLFNRFDFEVFWDIFVDKEYNVELNNPPKVIIDLGSNVGYSVIFFKLKYPEARVYACEPIRETYQRLQANTRQFDDNSVSTHQIAIVDKKGQTTMYASRKKSMSASVHLRDSSFKQKTETVNVTNLEKFFADNNIDHADLLKFDVEGAEGLIFQDRFAVDHVDVIIGEAHYGLMETQKNRFLSFFEGCELITCGNKSKPREKIIARCS